MKTTAGKAISLFISISFMLSSCDKPQTAEADFRVVPLPQEIVATTGEGFTLNKKTQIQYPQGDETQKRNAEFLSLYLKQITGLRLQVTDEPTPGNAIVLKNDYTSQTKEAYKITVDSRHIAIDGVDEAGVFYGIQTLRKSMAGVSSANEVLLPACEIKDYPRFAYRGTHLDVARHLFAVEDIKTFIDMLALHNINTFHWHLTDDQGWRIEIKSRPELTEISSMRAQTVIGKNTGEFDGTPYGGFYTQEEVKELIRYAQERFITIIPEVDLPGHMVAALTAYPQLGCTGGPYEVEGQWGVFDDVLCAGNDEIFVFLEDVYTELMELFPSEYINVGGDECPKVRWEQCPKCQKRIKELGLKSDAGHTKEEYLQSYVIQRMEKFINSKGRRIIGWDEILEGGIAPNATILSWRGIEGGITAARQQHDVIMVPTSYLYFDYYQSQDHATEPFGIGGYVPVEKVYNFNPLPEVLTEEERKYIIGVQANLWTEYIKTPEHMQYMYLPRMAALSEVQWMKQENRDYADFLPRIMSLTRLYDLLGYHYAEHIFDVVPAASADFEKNELQLTLATADGAPVYYTLNDENPARNGILYDRPIRVAASATLKAVADRNGETRRIFTKTYDINKATFKPIRLLHAPSTNYANENHTALVDGVKSTKAYNTGEWIGFYGADLNAVIDLEDLMEVSKVCVGNYISLYDAIFPTTGIRILVSDDNIRFTEVYNQQITDRPSEQNGNILRHEAQFEPVNARYVNVVLNTLKSRPEWIKGAGQPAYLFVDEIQIY